MDLSEKSAVNSPFMQQTNTRARAEPTVEAERLHRKQRLAAAFRLWAKLGYDEGPAGHITARDPELLDHFWVNPFGRHFSMISVSDLLLVNHHGEVVEGTDVVNRAAFAIHSQIHQARPDVISAAHCHSMHGKAWSSLGRLLDPITQDACAPKPRDVRRLHRCRALADGGCGSHRPR
jgi:ribulose-5-phosphate 4-epimerase/fuculose-1-phosphate aldolase